MTSRVFRVLVVSTVAAMAMVFPDLNVSGQMPARAPRYAITNARIVTAAGAPIEKGTLVMRDGVIEDVGASVAAPADALVVDGSGLVVYPGLIDMSNNTIVEGGTPPPTTAAGAAAPTTQTGRGRGANVATPDNITWADQEREARTRFLHPDVDAAKIVEFEGDALRRLAAAGITSALAVPAQGIIRGQSALVNITAPPDPAETSALATYRRGSVVVRSGVAQHVVFATGRGGGEGGGGGGGGYPGALLGVIAFARQSFLDAQWQKDAKGFAERRKEAAVGTFEPALDALAPTLDRRMPVAFDASEEREIVRVLAFAKEFNLDPIIVGGAEAANLIDDLKAAKARVIVSANFQAAGGAGGGRFGGGGRGGGEVDTPIRITRMRQNAAKVPAALEKAGIPFAFTIGGLQNPADFVRNVGRSVKEGGLSEDAAIRALTVNAAKLAGAGDRLGTIEKGKMANVVVTEGNLLESPRIRHVFVAGWPIDLDVPVQGLPGRGGRGANPNH
jgi:imidazolonepropionase-like amidohydrolase